MTKVSANKGEWSELFALATILERGGAHAADGHLKPIKSKFFKVTKILLSRGIADGHTFYGVHPDGTLSLTVGDRSQTLDRLDIRAALEDLLVDLQESGYSGSFYSTSGAVLLELLGLERPSAASSEMSSDFDLVLEDPSSLGTTIQSSVSVKSQLGAPATLLNASKLTNITFSLGGSSDLDSSLVARLNSLNWIETREALKAAGCQPEYREYDGKIFHENLKKVDSSMPEVLANLISCHYFDGATSLSEAALDCYPPHLSSSSQVIYKIKELVGVLAMGMRPNSEWSGDPSSFKGMVVVNKSGEVVLFYLFNVLEFRDFLFHSLKFERGSASRHGWGQIYEEQGEWRIKLNLQLRFVN